MARAYTVRLPDDVANLLTSGGRSMRDGITAAVAAARSQIGTGTDIPAAAPDQPITAATARPATITITVQCD